MDSGTHWQVVGAAPAQVSPPAQAAHRAGSPHPWLASVGTQTPPHAFVPAPQTPTTQEVPLQTTVLPALGAGQLAEEHVVAAQPNVGSAIETQTPPQSL